MSVIGIDRCLYCCKPISQSPKGRTKSYCDAACRNGAARERTRLVPEQPKPLTEAEAYEIPTTYSIRLNSEWTLTDLMNGEYGLRKGGWMWGYCHTKAEMLDVVATECGPVRASVMEAIHRWPARG